MSGNELIIGLNDPILVTGSNGFIGSKVVEALLEYGFKNLRCFVRPSSDLASLLRVVDSFQEVNVQIIKGNLLAPGDCRKATEGVSVIYHLAAGIDKSFAGAFMNSVVATRNLLDATLAEKSLKRFLNVSSFAVYSNREIKRGGILDETCSVESKPASRGEAYCYGKVKQDELILKYHAKYGLPYVLVRPGAVYGPGKNAITGRVGIGTFGIYLHLGGSNRLPLTYVDNCAYAIVLAGVKPGINREIFNIIDDDLPTSKEFLTDYKKKVRPFSSISIPYRLSYLLSYLWEKYSDWSEGQLPPVFNRSRCMTEWKGNRYPNEKLKRLLGWEAKISTAEGLKRYFEYSKEAGGCH